MMRLLKAIEEGDEKLVRSLIKQGVVVKRSDRKGNDSYGYGNALHRLVIKNWELDYPLSDEEATPEERKELKNEKERRKRDEAQCKIRILDMLIQAGINVNVTTKFGFTALFNAIDDSTYIEVIESLLNHGCDVNTTYHYTRSGLPYNGTALHKALARESINTYEYNLRLINLLLEYGADPSIKDTLGWNAVEFYILNYGNDEVIAEHRYDYPALEPDILALFPLSNIGMNILHISSIFDGYYDFRMLVGRPGIYVDTKDRLGYTPLFYIVVTFPKYVIPDTQQTWKMMLLLSLGADVNRKYRRYWEHQAPIDMFDFARYSGIVYDRTIYSILLQHAAILAQSKSDDETTCPFNLHDRDIQGQPLMEMWTDYLREIKAMKTYMLVDGISFFDVIVADWKKSMLYAKNYQIYYALDVLHYEGKFPFYEPWLWHTKFGLTMQRRRILDKAVIVLFTILEFADPSDEFYERTLSYFSNDELILLLDSRSM